MLGIEDEIYQQIKQAIIQQKLMPNNQLVEEVIAESFEVSRTPVRNVLRRLARERLVKIIPHKGTFVACPTVEEAKEVFEMRKVLESAGMRMACQHLTMDDYERITSLIQKEHLARDKGDLFEALHFSCDFHLTLARLTRNSYFYGYLEELISISYVIMSFYGRRQLAICGLGDHSEILKALREGDEHHAAQWMIDHLQHIEESLDFPEESTSTDLSTIFKRRPHS